MKKFKPKKRPPYLNTSLRGCYGKKFDKLPDCRGCDARKWCAKSLDPYRISGATGLFYEDFILPLSYNEDFNFDTKNPDDVPRYSRNDMIRLIGFIFSLDFKMFEIIGMILEDPSLTLGDIAKIKNKTRQGVYALFKRRLRTHPEIEAVIKVKKKPQTEKEGV